MRQVMQESGEGEDDETFAEVGERDDNVEVFGLRGGEGM